MNKTYRCIITMLSFILLFGCATHIPLSSINGNKIKTISLNKKMYKPREIYYLASGVELGLIGSVVALSQNLPEKLQNYAEKNKISIEDIINKQWQNQINSTTKFKIKDDHADAVLNTEIIMYGISIRRGFSTDYVPILSINAKLVQQGKVVWEHHGAALCLTDGLPRYKIDEIMGNPAVLRNMWNKASEITIHNMLADISKN